MSHSKIAAAIRLGLLALVALMPFHAFFSVWLGSLTHHQAIIQAWKEVLLVVLAALGLMLIIRDPTSRQRLRSWPAYLAGAFAALAFIVTIVARPSLTAIAFGAKTDLEFLVAFVLATLVATPQFNRRLTLATLATAGLVIGFGLLQFTVLPANFLTHFGYGPGTVAPYLVLDPAVKSLRFASTLGGPNQLGTYLMLPLALASIMALRRRWWWALALVAGGGLVAIHTYSRAAWVGISITILIAAITLTPVKIRSRITILTIALGALGALIITQLLQTRSTLQYYIFHSSSLWHGQRGSDYQHLASLRQGLDASLHTPLGHGLGTAGPATFHAGTSTIIENNYLQLAYETGLVGAALFIALLAVTAWQLLRQADRNDLAASALAALVGVSVTALVLPAWTDSTTSLILWTTAGAALGTHASAQPINEPSRV